MGERSEHIALPELYDFIRETASIDANARKHVEQCPQCRTDVNWLQSLLRFGVSEKKYDPPSWATTNAEKLFKLKKPGVVRLAKEIVASLVYDSFNDPLPFGVRQRDLPARQALYRTDNVQLDLKIEVGEETGLIIGQVVADEPNVKTDGLHVELIQGGRVISQSSTNTLGEFVFHDLPKGDYELQVVLSDTMVKFPPLPTLN